MTLHDFPVNVIQEGGSCRKAGALFPICIYLRHSIWMRCAFRMYTTTKLFSINELHCLVFLTRRR